MYILSYKTTSFKMEVIKWLVNLGSREARNLTADYHIRYLHRKMHRKAKA